MSVFVIMLLFILVEIDVIVGDTISKVNLRQGILLGKMIELEPRKVVSAFLGVPYAVPPVNNLRFAPPVPHMGWNGTYNGFKYGPSCPQLPHHPNQNEDCLYLNIWAPQTASLKASLPVVVIFDESDLIKTTSSFSGENLALEGFVVVTVNYRLNVFGFLCLGNEKLRGNLALLDQYLSLVWIKENIEAFRGNPLKVLLYGQYESAVNILLHTLSPRTKGYFHSAIISYGHSPPAWYLNNDSINLSREIVKIINCDNFNVDLILQCLTTKSTRDILQGYEEYNKLTQYNNILSPVVDTFLPQNNQYLPMGPAEAFKSKYYINIPVLIGYTKPKIAASQEWQQLAKEGYEELYTYMVQFKIQEIIQFHRLNILNQEQVADLIKWKYATVGDKDAFLLLEQLKNMEYDSKIEALYYLQFKYLSYFNSQPTYVYYLDQEFSSSRDSTPADWFTMNRQGRNYQNVNEIQFKKYIRQLWLNFMNHGNPTPNNYARIWNRYNANENNIEYLGINYKSFNDKKLERMQKMSFWTDLLPTVSQYQNVPLEEIGNELQITFDATAAYKHAVYTLLGLVIALLCILMICITLLKRRSRIIEGYF